MSHHLTRDGDRLYRRGGMSGRDLALGLGWFSIGLGLMEVLAPATLTRAMGTEGREGLVRAFGLREIAAGVGILVSSDPKPWVEARVAGDVLDMAALAAALPDNPRQGTVMTALAAVLGAAALDIYCTRVLAQEREHAERPTPDYSDRVGMARPADEMRGAARDFETPRDMQSGYAAAPGQPRLH